MYLYSPSLPHYYDHIAWSEPAAGWQQGDVLVAGDDWYLCLGEDLVWTGVAHAKKPVVLTNEVTHIASALTGPTMHMIDRLVSYRYAQYKDIIPLYFSHKRPAGYRHQWRMPKRKKTAPTLPSLLPDPYLPKRQSASRLPARGQHLVLFPTVRSLAQYVQMLPPDLSPLVIHTRTTTRQQRTAYRDIVRGKASLVCATSRGLFFDRRYLQHITIVQHHDRHYKRQQHPRVAIVSCARQMAELYDAQLSLLGIEELRPIV